MTTNYAIRGGEQGRARLRTLARALWPTTEPLLRAAGIAAGMTCLDVGSGGGDVSFALARLVGSSGKVVGIDVDDTKLQLARDDAAREGLDNIEFRTSNVDELAAESEFDVVYARFLLTHLREPADALRRMMLAAKPGGVIVVEDIEHSVAFSVPPLAALQRHLRFYDEIVRRRGADPEIGPKLRGLFTQVGLSDARVTIAQPVITDGEEKRLHQITLENIAPTVIGAGLASEAEIDALIAELDAFTSQRDTIVGLPRIWQLFANRPDLRGQR